MTNFTKSSFLDDFELPTITHQNIKDNLLKITRTCSVQSNKSLENMPLEDRLKVIETEVYKILGRYKDFVKIIDNTNDLERYIDKAIKVGYLALDTETDNSLDPLTCKLMGLCLYVPNTRPVYVPMNHCYPGTENKLPNQVSEEDASRILKKLKATGTKLIYHNGKFDIRVINNTLGFYLPTWWDTMLAAQIINENERAGLKLQYQAHIDPTIGAYNIEKLFKALPYAWVSPEVFALYSAVDAYDTYRLQQYQESIFDEEDKLRMKNLFREIEMPVSPITAKMEDDGIYVDKEFLQKLDKKYRQDRDSAKERLDEILKDYSKEIEYYQNVGKLDNPINFESSIQLKIVLYEILKTKPLEEGSTATDKTTLKLLKTPFTKALLDFRHYAKLVNSFTTPLQEKISPVDGKLHSNFYQMGSEENNVVTGRFSSKDPNLQQMPSKEKCVRMMFKASTEEKNVEAHDNKLVFDLYSEIETPNGWCFIDKLNIGDTIYLYDGDVTLEKTIKDINIADKIYMEIE